MNPQINKSNQNSNKMSKRGTFRISLPLMRSLLMKIPSQIRKSSSHQVRRML